MEVVSLETAKKLKAAGYDGRGVATWWNIGGAGVTLKKGASPDFGTTEQYAAPSAEGIADNIPTFTIQKLNVGGYYAYVIEGHVSAEGASISETLALLWLRLQ